MAMEERGENWSGKGDVTMDHDSAIEKWRRYAERYDEENYRFLRSLKHRDYGYDPDELVSELHERAFQIVDCRRCANCCRTLHIRFEEQDIEQIAEHLSLSTVEFIETYLELDQDTRAYKTRDKPCPFLDDDNRCTIYAIRPTVCREYPYTDKEGLVFRTISVANNTLVCPAVYWIVDEMKRRSRRRRRTKR
jgi:Fe-S-cluster containining protein